MLPAPHIIFRMASLVYLHSKQLWSWRGVGRLQHLHQACSRPACPAAASHVGGPSWPKSCLVRLQHGAEPSDVPRPAATRCLCLGREVTLACWCFPTLSSEECERLGGGRAPPPLPGYSSLPTLWVRAPACPTLLALTLSSCQQPQGWLLLPQATDGLR